MKRALASLALLVSLGCATAAGPPSSTVYPGVVLGSSKASTFDGTLVYFMSVGWDTDEYGLHRKSFNGRVTLREYMLFVLGHREICVREMAYGRVAFEACRG